MFGETSVWLERDVCVRMRSTLNTYTVEKHGSYDGAHHLFPFV